MNQIIEIDIKSDVDRMFKQMSQVQKRDAPKALNQAINKTLKKAATVADVTIRKSLNLKKQTIRKQFTIVQSNKTKLQGTIIVRGRPQPIIDFDAKQTKRGVTFKIKKDKGRRIIKGAFIATMRSGRKGVFVRTFKKDVNPKKHGLPIEEKFTTSVMQAFTNQKVRKELFKLGKSFFFPEFQRNLTRLIQKRGK